jgi:multidrug efflux pump subunit AcrA (membrane-fusion protein)
LNDIQTKMESLQASVDRNVDVLARKKEAFEQADQRWARFVEHADVATPHMPALTPLRLAVEVRRRELEQIVRRIDDHTLRAPIDGQVTALWSRAGDRVGQGATLAVISPSSTDRVVAYLPEGMVASVRVGAPVSIAPLAPFDTTLRRFDGTVVSLSATVDEAPPRYRRVPSAPVWGRGLVISLGGGARLIPGETVTVSFPQ